MTLAPSGTLTLAPTASMVPPRIRMTCSVSVRPDCTSMNLPARMTVTAGDAAPCSAPHIAGIKAMHSRRLTAIFSTGVLEFRLLSSQRAAHGARQFFDDLFQFDIGGVVGRRNDNGIAVDAVNIART